ncbi:EpsG family protein [Aliivibrio salmonicida]|uniref:EpsG family protein n=1 Tax=Aliivibrio salmonicida TaxID=40269 RepID=UPI003D136CEC
MITYHVIFILLILFSLVERFNLLLSRYVPIFFSFIFVLLFTSLRGDVGQDTSNYLIMFSSPLEYKSHVELGYYLFSSSISYFGLSFNSFLFLIGFFSLSFYYVSISKFVPAGFVVIAFSIIFCDMYMYFNISGLRQGVALSICLLAAYYVINGYVIRFFILVSLAMLFHKSAFIFFLAYPISKLNVKYDFKHLLILFLGVLLLFYIVNFKLESMAFLNQIRGGAIYLSDSYNEFSFTSYLIGIVRRVYPIILAFIFFSKLKTDKTALFVFNIYVFGFLAYAVGYPVLQDVTVRLTSYFIIFESVLVVLILSKLNRHANVSLLATVIFLFVYLKIMVYANLPAFEYKYIDGIF